MEALTTVLKLENVTRKPRQKTFHHKVLSGCRTCKVGPQPDGTGLFVTPITNALMQIRRVKCDETRPSCKRCTKARRRCDGYESIPKPWMFEPSNLYDIYKTPEEVKLAQFYHVAGIGVLSMFALSTEPSLNVTVQQMARIHPPIKHATLALSAQMLATKYNYATDDSRRKSPVYRAEAMAQYNSAMRLLATDTYLSKEAILVCCALFVTFEIWPQRGTAPHVHVKAGLEIGRSEPQSVWKEQSVKGTILRAFVWLAHLLSAYYDIMSPPENTPLLVYPFRSSDAPRSFSFPPTAIESVETLLRSVMHLRNSAINLESRTKHGQLLHHHNKTSSILDDSISSTSDKPDVLHDLEMLRIHMHVISLMLQTYAAETESRWDSYSADFAEILAGVEQAMAYQELNPTTRGSASFYPSLGLISPLFCVATKSRDSRQQQHALRLLHKLKRKERTWNSCIAAQIARAVVNLENGFALKQGAQDIPEDCRVRLDSVAFEPHRQRILVFYRRMSIYKTCPKVESMAVPWEPLIDVHYDFVHMSKKALACFGYTGVHLVVPPIQCQCHPSAEKTSPASTDLSSEMSLELR